MDIANNIFGCLDKYNDYVSASDWFRRAKVECSVNELRALKDDVAERLGEGFGQHAIENIRGAIETLDSDLGERLKSVLGPFIEGQKRKRAEEQRQIEEATRRRLEEGERIRAKEQRLVELDKNIKKQLLDIESKATKGIFYAEIEESIRCLICDKDFFSAVARGARRYFENEIRAGDLPSYDKLGLNIPSELRAIFLEVKMGFVKDAIKEAIDIELDPDQLQVVIASDSKLKVIARAGSGKTRVLVAKAFYLMKFYRIRPDQVLLLAFNKKAATEMRDRLKGFLQLEAFHTARTFHSLAFQIVKPESSIVISDPEPVRDQVGKVVQKSLRKLWNPIFIAQIYRFFREESQSFEEAGLHLNDKEYFGFRREVPLVTLRGETVKSKGEKYIADFLFEHDIRYTYEPSFRMGSEGIYRPDFGLWIGQGLNKKRFIWEHWAFDPEGPIPSWIDGWTSNEITEYHSSIFRKKKYWKDKNWPLIESHSSMLSRGRDVFEQQIKELLQSQGISCVKLSEDILHKHIERNAKSKLANLLTQFIQRALASFDSLDHLRSEIRAYKSDDQRERFFLDLGLKILRIYTRELESSDEIDFSQLFPQARHILDKAGFIPKIHASGDHMIDINDLRWVLVDEAQDLSPQYLKLLDAIRELRPNLKLMFVGDDWQAINRFAGSNVDLFRTLNEHFNDNVSEHVLGNNYRSSRRTNKNRCASMWWPTR